MKDENQRGSASRRRVTVRYDGHVQGVGFRFTAVHLGSRFDVTGYVLNEYDGSVRLVAEGEEPVLLEFLRAIRLSPLGRYISGETASWSEATGEFDAFGVKF
ncbi:MAG: acylphosphatase [Verrucomicrobia bacterium]|nr:acylphosphatase [Verrucomicrobiota bacterium]